ncbi:E3 RID-alpha protein [Simian adenovirus ER]|uniref:E3 RID-alpha n=1 Tax=Simian adenovirus 48 TaxID=995021 RepID=A0A9W3I4Q9_9ADEN|nr:E3 RID-alpha [Simian adenovirus 48]UEC95862.1 E3 RID-alpha protein [Simian adenovirus ER]
MAKLILLLLLLTPVTLFTITFSAAATLQPQCLPPVEVYFVYVLLCCVSICSITCFTFVFLQCIDYFWVRLYYRKHAPQYQNQQIARLLGLP